MHKARFLILGAGPAGLTMAQMLRDRGETSVIVLEASDKVGGKCLSSPIGDHIVEFGTCYAIWSHKYILKKMKALGIRRSYLKAQRIDNRELMDYIRDGSGPGFIPQVLKYLRLRGRLLKRLGKGDVTVNAELARPTRDWLADHNLGKIENMMHRVVTSIGYGYLDRLPLIHAFRWVDFDMMLTGLLKFTVMPDGGWQNFWERFSDPLDVQLNANVTQVQRHAAGVSVTTENGDEFEAETLINTIPMADFCALTEATDDEKYVARSVDWAGYTTTLISVDTWPHDAPVNSWSDTCASDANDGKLLFYRYECPEEGGRQLFTVGQSSAAYSPSELIELVEFDSVQRGAVKPRVVQQVIWQYMPTYAAEPIRDGLLQTMASMQGAQRTFHTGATFSHEAVATISTFNEGLLAKVMS
ncbi:MAG: FAD-dependent oxidoreductase [Pseudomonadota bacterium]